MCQYYVLWPLDRYQTRLREGIEPPDPLFNYFPFDSGLDIYFYKYLTFHLLWGISVPPFPYPLSHSSLNLDYQRCICHFQVSLALFSVNYHWGSYLA